MTKTNTYKVVCEGIDLILHLKILSEEEEHSLFLQVRERISKSEKYFVFHEYKEYISRKIIVDYEEILSTYAKDIDSDDYTAVLNTMYKAVSLAYPMLALDFVCSDLNAEKFIVNSSDTDPNEFIKNLTSSLKEQIAKQKKTKKKSIPTSKHKFVAPIKTKAGFEKLEKDLKSSIIGQDHAVEVIIKHLKLISAGLSHSSSFFFVGPTGVGKTELSRLIGANYSGNFFKINCAEYAGAHEYAKLIGSPPGYVGHSDKSILKEKSDISNKWVFLFDEIEKADAKLSDFLLSLLDDGTCTDNMGNTLDFSQSLFIFTSNQGVGDVRYTSIGFNKEKPSSEAIKTTIFDSVKKKFSPEFMNRIDDVIFFNSLSKDNIKTIVSNKLCDYPIELTSGLVNYVIENAYSFEYGARNVARYIKNNVATVIAEDILEHPNKKNCKFKLDLVDNKLQIVDVIYEKKEPVKKAKKSNLKVLEASVGGEDKSSPQDEGGKEAPSSTVSS